MARMRRSEAVLLVRGSQGAPHLLASASLRGRMTPSEALLQETNGDVRYLLPPQEF
jgi:hypothetical protein